MAKERPHIIYILSDQHRGQAMNHTGDANINTPVMDSLAERGVSFERAYANCPICVPSRGTIFSGRHAHAGPITGFFDAYKPAAPSMATVLRAEGYHTAYFGKWHCGEVRNQMTKAVADAGDAWPGLPVRTPENLRGGFQDWAAFDYIDNPFNSYVYHGSDDEPTRLEGFQTDVLTEMVIEYLETYNKDQPLFMVLSVEPPHFPLNVPDRWKRHNPEQLQVRDNFNKMNPDFEDVVPQMDDHTMREILANYYAMVENLDWNIGRLEKVINAHAGFKNSLIVYFSDHGDYVGSHGLGTAKLTHHEESVRIPTIFKWRDRIPTRGLIPHLFSLVDLMPTVLGLVGVKVPPWVQGVNYSSLIIGETDHGSEEILLEMVANPRFEAGLFQDWRGLVTRKWKYAFYEDGRERLHDLENDPYELVDLSVTSPQVTKEMRQKLLQALHETREPFFDVIIEHGVTPDGPVRYVHDMQQLADRVKKKGGLAGYAGSINY